MYNKPVKIDSTILANRLKTCREDRDVSKSEMADDLNIARSSMTYYESGQAIPSIDKLYAIADYLNTSIDYLVGRIGKSIESIKTEKDVAELITRLTDYEGIDLVCDKDGAPVLSFESEVLNDFLKNRIDIEALKEEAGDAEIPERFFNEMFKSKSTNETYYLRDMAENQLTLKDGTSNATIRRKRRLADSEPRVAAQTIEYPKLAKIGDSTPTKRKRKQTIRDVAAETCKPEKEAPIPISKIKSIKEEKKDDGQS